MQRHETRDSAAHAERKGEAVAEGLRGARGLEAKSTLGGRQHPQNKFKLTASVTHTHTHASKHTHTHIFSCVSVGAFSGAGE